MSSLANQQQNLSFPGLLQVPGGITSTLQQVQDGNGNPTGLSLSSAGASVTTSSTFIVSENGVQIPDSVPRLISDGFGDFITIRDFGALGDGLHNDRTALVNADAVGTDIYMPRGNYLISSSVTISNRVIFSENAVLDIPNGVTVTFNGGLQAGLFNIFNCSGTGDVVLPSITTSTTYPEWWGAKGDGTTDDVTAINKCIAATVGGKVVFSSLEYAVSSSVIIAHGFIELEGIFFKNRTNSVKTLKSLSTSANVLTITAGTFSLEDITIRCMSFARSTQGAVGSKTISVVNVGFLEFHQCSFSGSQTVRYMQHVGWKDFDISCSIGGNYTSSAYGTYVDGTTTLNGYVLNQYLFYGNDVTSAISYAFYDIETSTGSGEGGLGDKRIIDFQTIGTVTYGFYGKDIGGFGADFFIDTFAMDAVTDAGIYIESTPGPSNYHQTNIINGWINLVNTVDSRYGIRLKGRANVSITDVNFGGGSGTATDTAIYASSCDNGNIQGCTTAGDQPFYSFATFDNAGYASANCDSWTIVGNTCRTPSTIRAEYLVNSIISSNAMPTSTLYLSAGSSYNKVSTNTFYTIINSGANNIISGYVENGVAPLASGTNGYLKFTAGNGVKMAQCWGVTAFNSSGQANITFPVTFSASPVVTASIFRGTTIPGNLMSTQTGTLSTSGCEIIGNYTSGGAITALGINESAAWAAVGPIA
jgi:hypothetical protein